MVGRLEVGDPKDILATALWVISPDGALGQAFEETTAAVSQPNLEVSFACAASPKRWET